MKLECLASFYICVDLERKRKSIDIIADIIFVGLAYLLSMQFEDWSFSSSVKRFISIQVIYLFNHFGGIWQYE